MKIKPKTTKEIREKAYKEFLKKFEGKKLIKVKGLDRWILK